MSLSHRERLGEALRVTTLRGLLDVLARRDAVGEISLAADGTRALRVARSGSPEPQPAVAVWVVFREACEGGLIAAADDSALRWVLSRAGRVELRRIRSQGEGAPSKAVGPAPCPEPNFSARIDPAESPLMWLRRRKDKAGVPMISAVQFDAGERLRADFLFAEMTPRVTVNWSAAGGNVNKSGGGLGVDMRDRVVAAQQRVRRALAAAGPISAGLLIDICGHLKGLEEIERARGWPARSGKIALQMALSELARHYGLPGADEGAKRVAARLNHWGLSDYRPTIEGSAEAGGEGG